MSDRNPKGLLLARLPSHSRNRLGKACAALLFGLVALLVCQAGLCLWFQCFRPELRDPHFSHKLHQLQQQLVRGPSAEVVIMLGSSRTSNGFNGHLIEEDLAQAAGRPVVAFNMGRSGACPIVEGLLLQRLLALRIRPSLLVLEIVPFQFSQRERYRSFGGMTHLHLAHDDLAYLRKYVPAVESEWCWWISSAVPVFAHRHALLQELAPILQCCRARATTRSSAGMDQSGYVPQYRPRSEEEWSLIEAKSRKEWLPVLAPMQGAVWDRDVPEVRALEDLLGLCRREGIPFLLVIMPEGLPMQTWYPKGSWERVEEELEALAHRYQCPLINARDWVGQDGFSDPSHLAVEGAAVFTRRFGREILGPTLAQLSHSRGLADQTACTTGK